LKPAQERAGNTLKLIVLRHVFLSRTKMALQLRERVNKLDYMSKKILHNSRKGHHIEEAAHGMGENFFQVWV
jgi:hypothetical protein